MNLLRCSLLGLGLAAVASADFSAPYFKLNLDLPPEERWKPAVRDVLARHGFANSFGNVMNSIYQLVPEDIIAAIDPIMEDIGHGLGDYGREIQGVFDVMVEDGYDKTQNLTYGRFVLVNFVYEFTAFCTSIVSQNVNGSVFHSRNLDFNYNGLTNITYTVEFTQRGHTVYYGTAFIGYVGLLTGMKPGAFSVTVDERGLSDPLWYIVFNLISAIQGGKSVGFFLRDQLAGNFTSFPDLINILNTTQLIAPVYLITAGANPGEAAVITRDRDHADDSDGVQNGVWNIAPPTAWFRVETNYDHWEPVPANDDRRDPANELMTALGPKSVGTDTLFKIMSTPPINNNQTTYTTIMSPSLNVFYTTVREH